MQKFITFLLLCHIASTEKYFLEVQFFQYFGVPNVPEFSVLVIVQGVKMFYYDDKNVTTTELTHDWMRNLIKENKEQWDYTIQVAKDCKQVIKAETASFNEPSNQTADIPVIQMIAGCELDDETNKAGGYLKYGNNGEEFLTFDMNTGTWIASGAKAEDIKKEWDRNVVRNDLLKDFISSFPIFWLNTTLGYGKSYLGRKDLPSVSLLQRSASSPVSCHATGFYPNKALIYWMKDGEEIHEGVEHGDILPNHDGSFQMNVDLEVSSIASKEWGRYDCVFQLLGVRNFIITKLSKDAIRTNSDTTDDNLSVVSIATIATVAVVIVIILAVLGLTAVKKRNLRSSLDRSSTPSSDTISL